MTNGIISYHCYRRVVIENIDVLVQLTSVYKSSSLLDEPFLASPVLICCGGLVFTSNPGGWGVLTEVFFYCNVLTTFLFAQEVGIEIPVLDANLQLDYIF